MGCPEIAEPLFNALHHHVPDHLAGDSSCRCRPADDLAVMAVQGKSNPHDLPIPAGELQHIRAPALIGATQILPKLVIGAQGVAETDTHCISASLTERIPDGELIVSSRSNVDELAARAGRCRSIAKRAVRFAEAIGLISVLRRPRSGRKHLPNLIRIMRRDWIDWLNKGNRRAYAAKVCARAKPDFQLVSLMRRGQARGVNIDPPRAQIFNPNPQRSTGNSGNNPWQWPPDKNKDAA
jgi:hypothetical protein